MPRTASTITPLTANQTYDSGALQPGLADSITGSVFSDQACTLLIEQSGDGVNYDVSTSYTVTAGDGKGFSEEVILPYVRVRVVNGGTNQGAFRLFARMTAAGSR
jgi:hypothetical protein